MTESDISLHGAKKAHIFLIINVQFYSWKVLRLEYVNENISGYDRHN